MLRTKRTVLLTFLMCSALFVGLPARQSLADDGSQQPLATAQDPRPLTFHSASLEHKQYRVGDTVRVNCNVEDPDGIAWVSPFWAYGDPPDKWGASVSYAQSSGGGLYITSNTRFGTWHVAGFQVTDRAGYVTEIWDYSWAKALGRTEVLADLSALEFEVLATPYPFVDVRGPVSHIEDILWLNDENISTGWAVAAGKEFRPNANVKRGDMAAFLFRLAKEWKVLGASDSWKPEERTKKKFTDVDETTSHAQAIWWLAQNGISTGWDKGSGKAEFRANSDVKRGDLAAFLSRLADKAGRKGASRINTRAFKDVNATTSHADEIWWMAASGISSGWTTSSGKEFRPNSSVKRGDMAAFLHRLDSVGKS